MFRSEINFEDTGIGIQQVLERKAQLLATGSDEEVFDEIGSEFPALRVSDLDSSRAVKYVLRKLARLGINQDQAHYTLFEWIQDGEFGNNIEWIADLIMNLPNAMRGALIAHMEQSYERAVALDMLEDFAYVQGKEKERRTGIPPVRWGVALRPSGNARKLDLANIKRIIDRLDALGELGKSQNQTREQALGATHPKK